MPPHEGPDRPAVFLDRDGTLIAEKEYLADPAGVEPIPGAAEALLALAGAGYRLVIVTNQSGIARGLYAEADFHAVQKRVEECFAEAGVRFDGVYYCPHHPEVTGPCECRKPGLGMYRRAARELGLDLARSIYVGDRVSDVLPARDLGGLGFLVRTGYGELHAAQAPPDVVVVDDVAEVARVVIRRS